MSPLQVPFVTIPTSQGYFISVSSQDIKAAKVAQIVCLGIQVILDLQNHASIPSTFPILNCLSTSPSATSGRLCKMSIFPRFCLQKIFYYFVKEMVLSGSSTPDAPCCCVHKLWPPSSYSGLYFWYTWLLYHSWPLLNHCRIPDVYVLPYFPGQGSILLTMIQHDTW